MSRGIVLEQDNIRGRRGFRLPIRRQQSRPGENNMIGIEIECLHFPRLIMVDHRDRHTQVHVCQGLILCIKDLDLIGAQQIDQAERVARRLADMQAQRTSGGSALAGLSLAEIESPGWHLNLKAAIAALEVQRLNGTSAHLTRIGLRAGQCLANGRHRRRLRARQRGLLRMADLPGLFFWWARIFVFRGLTLLPFATILREGQMSRLHRWREGSSIDLLGQKHPVDQYSARNNERK